MTTPNDAPREGADGVMAPKTTAAEHSRPHGEAATSAAVGARDAGAARQGSITNSVRVLSYGGGLDSFAMLLLAINEGPRPDLVVFANVADEGGEDPGEWDGTLRHIIDVAMPLCERHGIEFKWLTTDEYPIRGERSLFRYFEVKRLMPSRMSRMCTSAAKVERIAEYLFDRFGYAPLEVWIGFEAGEEERSKRDPHALGARVGPKRGRRAQNELRRTNRFPLQERGFCRCRCEAYVRRCGHPVPRKSACEFCGFATRGDFQVLARRKPTHYLRTVALERNCRTSKKGHRILFSGSAGKSLPEWIATQYVARVIACKVCGAKVRASKAAGCGYLSEVA
jgi:hypothetical protein